MASVPSNPPSTSSRAQQVSVRISRPLTCNDKPATSKESITPALADKRIDAIRSPACASVLFPDLWSAFEFDSKKAFGGTYAECSQRAGTVAFQARNRVLALIDKVRHSNYLLASLNF